MNKDWAKASSTGAMNLRALNSVAEEYPPIDKLRTVYTIPASSAGFIPKALATALLVGSAGFSTNFSAPNHSDANAGASVFAGVSKRTAGNASTTELPAPQVYKDMGGEISRMRHDLIAVNKAVQALSIQTAAIQVALAAVAVPDASVESSAPAVEALELALSRFDPNVAGDAEADALELAAELELRSTTVVSAARAGLQAVDSLVRAAAGRALGVTNRAMAAELLPSAIENETNATVRLIMASALRTALIR